MPLRITGQAGGPFFDSVGSTTIGATTVGVAGPSTPCFGAIANLPAAAGHLVTITDASKVGGTEMAKAGVYPLNITNLNQVTFVAAASATTNTVTINVFFYPQT